MIRRILTLPPILLLLDSNPLRAVEPDDDSFTDEDHGRLDRDVKRNLDHLLDHNFITEEESLENEFRPYVLCAVCRTATPYGLLDLAPGQAKKMIADYPQLSMMVNHAWIKGGKFKEIRCLKLLRIRSEDMALRAIEPDDDSITDADHGKLDEAFKESVRRLLRHRVIVERQSLIRNGQDWQADVLSAICQTAAYHGLLDLAVEKAQELITEYPQLGQVVDNAWIEGGGFKEIRRLKLLRIRSEDMESRAAVDSWTRDFVGSAHEALKQHILQYNRYSYSPHCAIVQSTGTGKSRTLDEFSKYNFVIPLNLRKPTVKGFPASDKQVYSFFETSIYAIRLRMNAFMFALFKKCDEVIKEATASRSKTWLRTEGAAWFRERMTEGQTMRSQGAYRVKFYDDVVDHARKIFKELLSREDDSPPRKKARAAIPENDASIRVVDMARSSISNWDHPENSLRGDKNPIVYLAFDEAHLLTPPYIDDTKFLSLLSHLQWVLHNCKSLRLFTIFLSTTGKIHLNEFVLPKGPEDSSNRVQSGILRTMPPFCALGWDHCAATFPVDKMKLSYVSSLEYQACLGRPLFGSRYISGSRLPASKERNELLSDIVEFAAQKLIGCDTTAWPGNLTPEQELACLSARLPVEFTSPPSTQAEKDQFTSLNPSEPIVSESAYLLMNSSRIKFHAPSALSRILSEFSVYQGDRGELVAMLALTMARDAAVNSLDADVFGVIPFLKALIPKPPQITDLFHNIMKMKPSVYQGPDDQNVTLKRAFEGVNLHFNHFVKRQQQNNLSKQLIRGFIARCAAVMGADNQPGLDMATPMIKGDLVEENTQSLIMYQVKNDSSYDATVKSHLFDLMDPVALGFIDAEEKLATPIIRIVFALGAKHPLLTTSRRKSKGISRRMIFGSPDSVQRGWTKMYDHRDLATQRLMKNMNPMVADEEPFWAFSEHADNSSGRREKDIVYIKYVCKSSYEWALRVRRDETMRAKREMEKVQENGITPIFDQ
ncbi:hypothetical protein BT96DRAFT_1024834 [Gymnopus androsaceus JB14]|uniref:Uncharacterized protein n=1 Tax=Gymnopus androsaceus JB14 TaxID=1447944 RepID=A0A6A4GWW5_9AGAR|nr:hypothetical protein BT96DRAFT_1024834 [Gymnopus androsaceus JB14]